MNQGLGARIGGGCDGAPGTITIGGGSITTEGGSGAGIGGGKGNKEGGCVTINGGVITANGDYGIGSGEEGASVSVTLDYTDTTRDTISITSGSYNGTVTLNQPFSRHSGSEEIMDALFMAGTVSDSSRLGGGKLKAWDGNITSWQELQGILDDAPDGMTIRLTQDISAVRGVDSKLDLAEEKNVILDLNGYTLSRALTYCSPEEDGHVITNYGTLTITDSSSDHSGKITGGNITDICGAIWNWGTLTLEGVTVSGNCAGLKAGAIWNWGTLTLDGAEISGNTSGQEAGGIYNEPNGVINLINAKITGNTSVLSGGGIYNIRNSQHLRRFRDQRQQRP